MSLKVLILSTFKGWLQLWIFMEEGEMEREGRVERRCMYAIGCVCVHVCVMACTEALSMYLLPRSCMW